MFAKHDEQVKLICILTFQKRYISINFRVFSHFQSQTQINVKRASVYVTERWRNVSSNTILYTMIDILVGGGQYGRNPENVNDKISSRITQ